MPLYEYRCDSCGKTFEVMQKFSDQPRSVHEGCGGAVERLLSRSALLFKGSGWYITDYARSGAKSDSNGGEAKPAAAKDSKSSESKPSESKPAAKDSSSDK
jgi:putative FmdB family regulatory protein